MSIKNQIIYTLYGNKEIIKYTFEIKSVGKFH